MKKEKFERIFNLYSKDVFRLSYSYLLNKQEAEDIVQKTFLKYYKKQNKLKLTDLKLKKWLFRVAINESKDYLKSYWHLKRTELNENISLNNNKYNEEIINALKNIPLNYRTIIYLYYYEGYSIKEISKIIKKSESAVKMRLSRGKELLKKEMEV